MVTSCCREIALTFPHHVMTLNAFQISNEIQKGSFEIIKYVQIRSFSYRYINMFIKNINYTIEIELVSS